MRRSTTIRKTNARRRLALWLALLSVVLLPTCRCGPEDLVPLPDPLKPVDIFEQNGAAKADILWVIDNSESMLEEQRRISNGFASFFRTLLESQVDYHIGVVTTDQAEAGVLRAYSGPAVPGCDGCRFLDTSVGCDDVEIDVSALSDASAEQQLFDSCQAQLVFRNLISAGIGGSPFEEGFLQASRALGLTLIDGETGKPTGEPPEANTGFLRDDAALYVIFVSDEDEGAKADGTPLVYYQRLFEGMKQRGGELRVSTSAIVGWPIDDDSLPGLDQLCPILETTFDGDRSTDDPRAAGVLEAMTAGTTCVFPPDVQEPTTRAETGSRYLELACRTGGVVTNLCADDYSEALNALGANAAGLLTKFILSEHERIEAGDDCELFTPDDVLLDCDENGEIEQGTIDGPICVKGIPLGGDGRVFAVPRSETSGWVYEPAIGAVRFRGRFIPAPGTQVEIRYQLRQEGSSCD